MKKYSIVIVALFVIISCNKSYVPAPTPVAVQGDNINQETTNESGTTILIGPVNENGLQQSPYNEWYAKGSTYQADANALKVLKKQLNNHTITAFFGSWCGDSKRDIPIFYEVLKQADFDMNRLKVIAVSNDEGLYKKDNNGETEGKNIHRVPTFIVYENGVEKGRIVEEPIKNIESDLGLIVSGFPYRDKYHAVTTLDRILKDAGPEVALNNYHHELNDATPPIQLRGKYDLNTYANTYLYDNNELGITVLEINRKIFPSDDYTLEKLIDGYLKFKQYGKAKAVLDGILYRNENDETAQKLLKRVNYFLEN